MTDLEPADGGSSFVGNKAQGQNRVEYSARTIGEEQKLREENRKDLAAKDRRRRENWGFFILLSLTVVSFVGSPLVATFSKDDTRQALGEASFLLILGGIIGGLVGYITSSKTR